MKSTFNILTLGTIITILSVLTVNISITLGIFQALLGASISLYSLWCMIKETK